MSVGDWINGTTANNYWVSSGGNTGDFFVSGGSVTAPFIPPSAPNGWIGEMLESPNALTPEQEEALRRMLAGAIDQEILKSGIFKENRPRRMLRCIK